MKCYDRHIMKNKSQNSNGTVLISGGCGVIGQSCAIKLAKLGYDIAFTWRSSKKEAIVLENKIISIGRNCIFLAYRKIYNRVLIKLFLQIN